jgi:hypothetical protein
MTRLRLSMSCATLDENLHVLYNAPDSRDESAVKSFLDRAYVAFLATRKFEGTARFRADVGDDLVGVVGGPDIGIAFGVSATTLETATGVVTEQLRVEAANQQKQWEYADDDLQTSTELSPRDWSPGRSADSSLFVCTKRFCFTKKKAAEFSVEKTDQVATWWSDRGDGSPGWCVGVVSSTHPDEDGFHDVKFRSNHHKKTTIWAYKLARTTYVMKTRPCPVHC